MKNTETDTCFSLSAAPQSLTEQSTDCAAKLLRKALSFPLSWSQVSQLSPCFLPFLLDLEEFVPLMSCCSLLLASEIYLLHKLPCRRYPNNLCWLSIVVTLFASSSTSNDVDNENVMLSFTNS